MAIKSWTISLVKPNTMIATVVLAAGDTSTDLNLPDYPDKTVYIFGTFGDSAVSLKGRNNASGTYFSVRQPHPNLVYVEHQHWVHELRQLH